MVIVPSRPDSAAGDRSPPEVDRYACYNQAMRVVSLLLSLLLSSADPGQAASPAPTPPLGAAPTARPDVRPDASVATLRFVSVEQARALWQAGAAVLDAREKGFIWGHIPSAQPIDWRDYRDGWGRTGRLHADPAHMAAKLAALGVDADRPVLVYGDAHSGYGEEGRIAWLLAYLGHQQVQLLDGGFAAWRQAKQPLARGPVLRSPVAGKFAPQVQAGLRADQAAVKKAVSTVDNRPILLDVRSQAEWLGATPYYEARGGHIPGARSLEWLRLLDPTGHLRDPQSLRHELAQLGITDPHHEIILYCTGGVRSAFAWAVLRTLGFTQVRNYDASFWEWSANRSLPVQITAQPAPAR